MYLYHTTRTSPPRSRTAPHITISTSTTSWGGLPRLPPICLRDRDDPGYLVCLRCPKPYRVHTTGRARALALHNSEPSFSPALLHLSPCNLSHQYQIPIPVCPAPCIVHRAPVHRPPYPVRRTRYLHTVVPSTRPNIPRISFFTRLISFMPCVLCVRCRCRSRLHVPASYDLCTAPSLRVHSAGSWTFRDAGLMEENTLASHARETGVPDETIYGIELLSSGLCFVTARLPISEATYHGRYHDRYLRSKRSRRKQRVGVEHKGLSTYSDHHDAARRFELSSATHTHTFPNHPEPRTRRSSFIT